jgi:hypothetical protein
MFAIFTVKSMYLDMLDDGTKYLKKYLKRPARDTSRLS